MIKLGKIYSSKLLFYFSDEGCGLYSQKAKTKNFEIKRIIGLRSVNL